MEKRPAFYLKSNPLFKFSHSVNSCFSTTVPTSGTIMTTHTGVLTTIGLEKKEFFRIMVPGLPDPAR